MSKAIKSQNKRSYNKRYERSASPQKEATLPLLLKVNIILSMALLVIIIIVTISSFF
jgi:hypothetical protein